VMNSGILANPGPGAAFNYQPADVQIIERATALKEICERHDVPLRAAAVQFVLAHPAITSIVAGVRTVEHLDEYPELMRVQIPTDLWAALRERGVIDAGAPVPGEV